MPNDIEEAERLKNLRPLKYVYAEELVQKLQNAALTESVESVRFLTNLVG